jgi:hypothetical protein
VSLSEAPICSQPSLKRSDRPPKDRVGQHYHFIHTLRTFRELVHPRDEAILLRL